jgi:hypothetical protein
MKEKNTLSEEERERERGDTRNERERNRRYAMLKTVR